MPVAYRSSSVGGTVGVSAASHTLDYPAGLEATDVVVVAVSFDDDATPDPTVTITGLTELTEAYDVPLGTHVFVGTGFSGVGAWTVNFSASAYGNSVATAWTGADVNDIVLGTWLRAGADSKGDFVVPGMTTLEPGETILIFTQRYSGDYPTSTTPTFTQRARRGNVSILSIADPDAGATGDVAGVASAWNFVQALLISLPEGVAAGSVPGAVDDLVATETGPGEVTLAWTAPDPGSEVITDYEVQYRTGASGNFKVSGTQILDPDGNVFYPFGMNTGLHYTNFPYPFMFTSVEDEMGAVNSYELDPVTYPSNVEAARAWGWNIFRTNVVAFNTDLAPTGAGTVDLIAHAVNELLAAGFVVLMDGRTNQPGDDTSTLGSANDLNARSFFGRCLELWGGNPLFWINPFNEPFSDEDSISIASMITLYSDWITFLRGAGYANPIVFDLPRYGQALNKLADGTFDAFAELDENLIFGWHNYGFPDGMADTDGTVTETLAAQVAARGHCVLIGETGYRYDGISDIVAAGAYEANVQAVEWATIDGRAQFFNMGVTAWHAGHDHHSLVPPDGSGNLAPFYTSPNDGTGLTAYGDLIWDQGQALFAGRAISGKYDGHIATLQGDWTVFVDGVSDVPGAVITGL